MGKRIRFMGWCKWVDWYVEMDGLCKCLEELNTDLDRCDVYVLKEVDGS